MIENSSGWTLTPTVERETREARRGEIACRRVGWALFLTSFGACPLACLTFMPYPASSLPLGMVYGAFALEIALAIQWARYCVHDFDRRTARQRALQKEFADVEGCPVAITIRQGAAPTGFDQGSPGSKTSASTSWVGAPRSASARGAEAPYANRSRSRGFVRR